MLPAASAADCEVAATGFDPDGRGFFDALDPALRIAFFLACEFEGDYVAGCTEGDERGHSVDAGNAVAFGGHTCDLDTFEGGEFLAFA